MRANLRIDYTGSIEPGTSFIKSQDIQAAHALRDLHKLYLSPTIISPVDIVTVKTC